MIQILAKIPQRQREVRSEKSHSGTVYVTKQGGLSDEVFDSHILQDYMKRVPCGYIGSTQRTVWADVMVEQALRDTGLKANGIATWLTSGQGRHLADNIERGQKAQFAKTVVEYTKNAFLQVTVWSHPDHGGMLSDTQRLEKMIFALKAS